MKKKQTVPQFSGPLTTPPEEGEALRMLDRQLGERQRQLISLAVQVGNEHNAYQTALRTAAEKAGITDPGDWSIDLGTLAWTKR
jgi:hypothetical protein